MERAIIVVFHPLHGVYLYTNVSKVTVVWRINNCVVPTYDILSVTYLPPKLDNVLDISLTEND